MKITHSTMEKERINKLKESTNNHNKSDFLKMCGISEKMLLEDIQKRTSSDPEKTAAQVAKVEKLLQEKPREFKKAFISILAKHTRHITNFRDTSDQVLVETRNHILKILNTDDTEFDALKKEVRETLTYKYSSDYNFQKNMSEFEPKSIPKDPNKLQTKQEKLILLPKDLQKQILNMIISLANVQS